MTHTRKDPQWRAILLIFPNQKNVKYVKKNVPLLLTMIIKIIFLEVFFVEIAISDLVILRMKFLS